MSKQKMITEFPQLWGPPVHAVPGIRSCILPATTVRENMQLPHAAYAFSILLGPDSSTCLCPFCLLGRGGGSSGREGSCPGRDSASCPEESSELVTPIGGLDHLRLRPGRTGASRKDPGGYLCRSPMQNDFSICACFIRPSSCNRNLSSSSLLHCASPLSQRATEEERVSLLFTGSRPCRDQTFIILPNRASGQWHNVLHTTQSL